MKTLISIIVSIVIFASAFTIQVKFYTYQLKGTVIAADTKQPIANAYLYIVKGEEEVLTNTKGEFTLTTAEKIPCAITIIHKDFKQQKITVKNISEPIMISLERK